LEQQERHSTGLKLTRRRLLGVTGGMGLFFAGSWPALAQRTVVTDATERRQIMDITRNGSRPSNKGPEAYFSGSVRVDPVFQVGEPVRLNAGNVTFEPAHAPHGIRTRSVKP
jgi:hypothetical protein